VDHVRHVYEIIDRLRSRHPGLEIESCASGGGRVDLGILTRTEQVWPSDNTDAFDRLSIQEGFSLAYTPKVMMAWVTDVPTLNGRVTSLEYRFLVAMSGSLGIGANLLTWNDEEMALAGRMIALYKSIRGMVQEGDLFRLLSPRKGRTAASQYVSRDGRQAVLFAFSQTSQFGCEVPAIKLRGLDERAVYRMQSVNGRLDGPAELSGAALMHRGLRLNLRGDYDGTAVLVERLA
jgi:alpha-galactosidase